MARKRRTPPPARTQQRDDIVEKPRVVVQFRPEVRIPYKDGAETELERLNAGPWSKLTAEFPGITLKTMIRTTSPEAVQKLVDRAREMDRTYIPGHFLGYFFIESESLLDLQPVSYTHLTLPTILRV